MIALTEIMITSAQILVVISSDLQCTLEKKTVKKVNPETACRKIPRLVSLLRNAFNCKTNKHQILTSQGDLCPIQL